MGGEDALRVFLHREGKEQYLRGGGPEGGKVVVDLILRRGARPQSLRTGPPQLLLARLLEPGRTCLGHAGKARQEIRVAREGRLKAQSKLYDRTFSHGYRAGKTD